MNTPKYVPGNVVYRLYEPESLNIKPLFIVSVEMVGVQVTDDGIKESHQFKYKGFLNVGAQTEYGGVTRIEVDNILESQLYPDRETAIRDAEVTAKQIIREVNKLD